MIELFEFNVKGNKYIFLLQYIAREKLVVTEAFVYISSLAML